MGEASIWHWAVILIIIGGVIGIAYFMKGRSKPLAGTSEAEPLKGIGGWLALVALGVILMPFFLAYSLASTLTAFQYLGSAPANLATLIILEAAVISGFFVLSIVLAVKFFKTRASAPKLYIGLLAGLAAFNLFEVVALVGITGKAADPESMKDLIRSVLAAAVWIPYMLISKRVKKTFVN